MILTLNDIKTVGHFPQKTIVNADCLEAMKFIEDKSVDMVLCDLPYG
jgi:DNA modification methylase